MDEQPTDRMVTLKTGARLDPGRAAALMVSFQAIQECAPDRFEALRDLATGRVTTPSPEIHQEFQQRLFLDPDGGLRADVREVFLACYRETPEGPCIVEPFRPDGEEEVKTLRDFQHGMEARFRTLRKRLDRRRPDDDSPGRG